jgi:aspartyl-tRNA(Asn)/glutamyl-tRNA(Gln) amidotransferase subunit A
MSARRDPPSDAVGIAECVRRRECSAREILDLTLSRLAERNPTLNAFIHVDEDLARASADAVDRQARFGDVGALAGVPIGVKDVDACSGMPTALGSALYRDRPAAQTDAVPIARLRAAGCVPIGKTAMPEFGIDTATLSPGWGITRNPWNPARTPGGSSGGSASAVASAIVPLATGSDSGGSIRGPAAVCGLVGLKPTTGLVPAPGSGPSGMLTHGALVTSVRDAARHLDVVAGPDDTDPRSISRPDQSFERALATELPRQLRIGWSGDLGFAVVDPAATEVSKEAARQLAMCCGVELLDVAIDWPNSEEIWWEATILDTWMLVEPGLWPDSRATFAPTTSRFLGRTALLTAAHFAEQLRRRHRLELDIAKTFETLDVLLTPTMASTAFPAGESVPTLVNGIVMPDGAEPFTAFANVAGLPALSVPAGNGPDGLPVGLQIVAHRFQDALVLRLARELELIRPWPASAPWPPVVAGDRRVAVT